MSKRAKEVEKKAKEAEDLMKGLQPGEPGTPAEPGTSVTPAEPTTPVEPATPTEPVAPTEPATPTEPTTPVTPAENYETKYNDLLNKYNREIPSLHDEMAEQKLAVNDLQEKLNKKADVPSDSGEPEGLAYLRKEIPAIEEAIRFIAKETIKEEMGSIAQRVTTVESNSVETSKSSFVRDLTSKAPDWRVVNLEPGFTDWLNQTPKYGRKTKLELMKEAHVLWDADTVASFFTDYKKEKPGAVIPSNTPTQKGDLTTLQSPPKGTGDGNVTPVVKEAEIVTRQFVNDFYLKKSKGGYKGMEKQAQEIEAKIDKAASLGLIQ